jgi:O-antigen/teichoic acid export membrane protein
LFKKISYYILPSIIGAILPIVTLPILSRKLTVEEYGIYALLLVFATFVSGISNLGLTSSYERNYFEQKSIENQGKLLYTILIFISLVFILLTIIIFIFKNYISSLVTGSRNYGLHLLICYISVSLSSFKQYFLLYFKNVSNSKAFAWFSIDEILLNSISGLILVIYFNLGIFGLVLGNLIGSSIVVLLLIIRFAKILPFGISFKFLKNSLEISLPLTPRIFFGVIGTHFDKYMISLMGNVGNVGIYNLGQKISYVTFNYLTALQNIYSPKVYNLMFENGDDNDGLIGNYLTIPFFVSVLGGLFISLFSEELIIILTPPSYHDAINIVPILTVMYTVYFFGKQPQLIFAKKTGIISYLTIIGIVINVIINIPMIKIYGVVGAAYGSLFASFLSGILSFYFSQKYFFIKWESVKIFYCLLAIILISTLHILLRYLNIQWSLRFFFKFIFLIVYVYGGLYLQIFDFRKLKKSIKLFIKNRKF